MRRKMTCAGLVLFLIGTPLLASDKRQQSGAATNLTPESLKVFAPLPEALASRSGPPIKEQVELGRMLYFDVRLSKSQTISCNSCHPLVKYGVDGQPTSEGYRGQHGDRNAPSVYNAAGHFAQFWDGRAADVEEQAKGPVRNPVEMAMPSDEAVVTVLRSMPEYVTSFRRAFPKIPDPVSMNNLGIAIGAFERTLLTPGRWDRFLQGDETVLTAEEKSGLKVFLATGCQTCHGGVFVGGDSFQKLGVGRPYFDISDPGRYRVTENLADRLVFKVPSLRNVAMTAPYFHNGKISSLAEAVRQMSGYQRGRQLSGAEIYAIVAWLGTLTGDLPADCFQEPVLPKSTEATPHPTTGG